VPLLVEHFLRRWWHRPGETPRWTRRAQRALQTYAYPGNVRELAHVVERVCWLARGPELDVELLPSELVAAAPDPAAAPTFGELTGEALNEAREAAVAAVEVLFLCSLMRRCQGNVSRAAREAGLHRSYLQKLLARHRAALAGAVKGDNHH
jgi:Nif-specific regulatory protein/two-component system response regulator HydG